MSQMLDRVSLASYMEYPTDKPFINTHPITHPNTHPNTHSITHPNTQSITHPNTHPNTHRPAKTVKAFPESSSAEILSALQNLQVKIDRLELERLRAEQNLRSFHTGNISHRKPPQNKNTHTHNTHVSQVAAVEGGVLEKRLDVKNRTVRSIESDQECVDRSDVCMKLEKLEQDYRRLTHTQNNAEVKIRLLECKLLEEEHHRKLIQDKAAQLQTGLEANRILIESVSPRPPRTSKSTKIIPPSEKPSQQRHNYRQTHYRLSLADVPFVAGTSTGTSHSVRANVQHVLHLLKQHNPQLCNERVLGSTPPHHGREGSEQKYRGRSSSSSSCSEDLSELLRTLQDEFTHISIEHQELGKQVQACRSDRLRRDLEREMENLVKKMEEKGEQMAKVRRHQVQVEKMKKESRQHRGDLKLTSRPGERSKDSLRLLKDMRTLQTSLRSDQHHWEY